MVYYIGKMFFSYTSCYFLQGKYNGLELKCKEKRSLFGMVYGFEVV